jgi:lysophospholipase L1-like esterase
MNKKSALVNLATLVVTLLICFVVVETLLRLSWQVPGNSSFGYPNGLHIPDDTKGYTYQPGFIGLFPGRLYNNIEIRINSKGLRDYEHNYTHNSKYRILGLGDSVTFGSGIKIEDTYLSVLERLIRKNIDKKSDIIKTGINGYDFDQEYTYYIEELYKYNPDIVMIGVVLNDARIVDPISVKEWILKKNNADTITKTSQKSFLNNLYTYNFYKMTLIQLTHHKEIKAARDNYNREYFYYVYNLWKGEPWDNYSKKLIRLNDIAKSKKSRVVIVLFPYTQQFKYAEDYGRIPQEKITALALENGIEVIDLYEILNRKDYIQFYLRSDNTHLNEKGNKLVGEFIYNEMLKKGLIKL